MNRLSAGFGLVVGGLVCIGCEDPSPGAYVDVASHRDSLPDCNDDSPQELVYVQADDQLVVCFHGAWYDVKPRGEQGARGLQGVQGPEGEEGPRGPRGNEGPAGSIGAKGDEGDPGPQGPSGLQGQTGAPAAVRVSNEPSGTNCGLGGIRVDSGTDANQSGYLDNWEVKSSAFVCTPRRLPRRVFVSSETYTGDLGGLDGADAHCQRLANSVPELEGSIFRAWLSSLYGSSPATRFARDAPLGFVRTDGVKIANSWAELTSNAALLAPILLSESGESTATSLVWSSTSNQGQNTGIGDCSGWTLANGSYAAGLGTSSSTYEWATSFTTGGSYLTQTCNEKARLYCFEQ